MKRSYIPPALKGMQSVPGVIYPVLPAGDKRIGNKLLTRKQLARRLKPIAKSINDAMKDKP